LTAISIRTVTVSGFAWRFRSVAFRVARPDELDWITRPHEPGEPARHVAELSEGLGFAHTRANAWRYEPGAVGRRHRHGEQEETFVVVAGTLSLYVGDPPERVDVHARGVVHVEGGTPLQSANHGDEELVVYVYGAPSDEGAEVLDSAV
jgi:mannose-6-phosphate isomerase-like protein (cupin superfamily)